MPPPYAYVRYLLGQAGSLRTRILLGGVVSGLCQGLAVVVVGGALDDLDHGAAPSLRSALLFCACVVAFFFAYRTAVAASSRTMTEALIAFRLRLSDKLVRVRFAAFTQIEHDRIYENLVGEKDIVVEASRSFVTVLSSGAIAACSFAYASYVSPAAFGIVVSTLALCGLIYMGVYREFLACSERAEARQRRLSAALRGLIDGFAELKMHRRRGDAYFSRHVVPLHAAATDAGRATEDQHVRATVLFSSLVFLPVGGVVFLLPKVSGIDSDALIKLLGITLVTLGPVMGLVLFVPAASKAWRALVGLMTFEAELDRARDPEETASPRPPSFDTIEIRDGRFTYPGRAGDAFSLHIDRFSIRRGDLVFLTGGNGAGKTTLMRVVAGLEPLAAGTLLVDGRPVSQVGIDNYRALFSALFADFHVFDALYGVHVERAVVEQHLEDVRLLPHVRFDGRRFSTTALSSGQRRRLALVCTELERRDVLLLDEVAADLDHASRERFYRTILPRLKAEGRTLLVISHDDRYFDVADRVLTMRDGHLDSDDGGGAE